MSDDGLLQDPVVAVILMVAVTVLITTGVYLWASGLPINQETEQGQDHGYKEWPGINSTTWNVDNLTVTASDGLFTVLSSNTTGRIPLSITNNGNDTVTPAELNLTCRLNDDLDGNYRVLAKETNTSNGWWICFYNRDDGTSSPDQVNYWHHDNISIQPNGTVNVSLIFYKEHTPRSSHGTVGANVLYTAGEGIEFVMEVEAYT